MNGYTTITQKGQITLPARLRKELGLKPYKKVRVEKGKGYIKVFPVKDILDMAGTVKPIRGRDALKARAWMEKHYQRI